MTRDVLALVMRQPDGPLLAEALGLVGYLGTDSASAQVGGKRPKKVWRDPIGTERTYDDRPLGDAWRHQRTQRAVRGERVA